MGTRLKLKVGEGLPRDAGRALVRLDPEHLQQLGSQLGDLVEVRGRRRTVGRAVPSFREHRGQGRAQVDGVLRENAGAGLGDVVTIARVEARAAERVALAPAGATCLGRQLRYVGKLVDGLPVVEGDRVRVALLGGQACDFRVQSTRPLGPVVIGPATRLSLGTAAGRDRPVERRASYEDVGGLGPQLRRIREMIELPLRHPEVFERLGIDAPKGVLLHGPPGCGKTLIARAIAAEAEARFDSINGPEIIDKFYGQSEAKLRRVFEEAAAKGPSIVFIDEIDAIAPRREHVVGEVEKRVVAQLLALMDGLKPRRRVVVIAATNLPNALDPALRRPGRFDREIEIPIPDRDGRMQILEIYSRGMPLGADVDLDHVAGVTHGFVGADLQALCREAAMSCVRRLAADNDLDVPQIPPVALAGLQVAMADFRSALNEVTPSAVREVFVEVPDVAWADVGGLDGVKRRLQQAVEWPVKYPALYERMGARPPKGLLLLGPPGCGKTLLAKALASQSEANFISVRGPELLSKYVGESERAVRDLFRRARQASPCIVFFDELDAVAPRRGTGGDSQVPERVLAQLLTELDGVEELRGVFVVGATNRADMIDPALLRPGRFEEVVEIPLPDEESRGRILEVHLRRAPRDSGIDTAHLARATAGASGAQIADLCRRAQLKAIERAVAANPAGLEALRLTAADLEAALAQVGSPQAARTSSGGAPGRG